MSLDFGPLSFLGSWMTLATAIDLAIRPEHRDALVQWVTSTEETNYPETFPCLARKVLEAIFGDRFLSPKRLWSTALVSLAMWCTFFFITWATLDQAVKEVIGLRALGSLDFWLFLLFTWGSLNLLPDLLSTSKSIWLLRRFGARKTSSRTIVALDLTLTVIVFTAFFTLVSSVALSEPLWYAPGFLWSMAGEYLTDMSGARFYDRYLSNWEWPDTQHDDTVVFITGRAVVACLLTSFAAPLWVALTLIARPVGQVVFWSRGQLSRVGQLLRFEEHPVICLGLISGTLVAIVDLVVSFLGRFP